MAGIGTTYPLTHENQGQALVFVNDTFKAKTAQEDRKGADLDAAYFTATFQSWGLTVDIKKNLDLKSTLMTLIHFAKDEKRSEENLMAIAFSSHGTQMELRSSQTDGVAADALYCTDGVLRLSNVTKLFTQVNCPGMQGKPKLFFIQACRGLKYDETLEGNPEQGWEPKTMTLLQDQMRPVEIPIFKDFFLAYSAPPGYLSFRSPTSGSWFVRCLHDITKHNKDLDLVSIMTLVKNKVALSEEFMVHKPNPEYPFEKNRKIVPWTVSMLTKDLIFNTSAKS